MLSGRLKPYRPWLMMKGPPGPASRYPPIDYQAASYFSAARAPGQRPAASRRSVGLAPPELRNPGECPACWARRREG